MKFLWYSIQTMFTLALLGVLGLFVLPYLPIDTNVELRIVQSGSMKPAISTGSLILVWPQTSYSVGDVIMFEDRNASVPTTHRIVDTVREADVTRFVTQGDANEDPDNALVANEDIYGTVAFALPNAGYVLDFSRQPIGFVLLIVLPALLLIIGEVEKIWQELRRRPDRVVRANKELITGPKTKSAPIQPTKTMQNNTTKMMDIMTPVRFCLPVTLDLRGVEPALAPRNFSMFTPGTLAVIVSAFGISTAVLATQYFQIGSTYSYFTDTEESEDNRFQAIALDFSAVADGEQFTFADGQLLGDVDGGVVTTVMPTDVSEPTRHSVNVVYISGSVPFCNAITVDSDEPVPFTGSLTSLQGTDIVFDTPWSADFALSDESRLVDGDTCDVEIVLSAWYIDEENGEGYSDEERVPLSFRFSSSTSVTARVSTPLRTEPESLSPLSSATLVVETEVESEPKQRGADEGQTNDADADPITDAEEIDGEIKLEDGTEEGVNTKGDETGKASGEVGEENVAATTEEESEEDGGESTEDAKAEVEIEKEAEVMEAAEEVESTEESVGETKEVHVEAELEEPATEALETDTDDVEASDAEGSE